MGREATLEVEVEKRVWAHVDHPDAQASSCCCSTLGEPLPRDLLLAEP